MFYTSYGYILIASNIYNIKSFKEDNEQAFKAIVDFQNDDPQGNASMSFEYDTNGRILIPFTFFGETAEQRNQIFTKAFNVIKKFFPSCKTLLKIDLKNDNNKEFFNDKVYDYLNEEVF